MLRLKLLYILTVSMLFTATPMFAQSQDPPTEEDLKRKLITREVNDITEGKWEFKVKYPELRLVGDKYADSFNAVAKNIAMTQIKDFRKTMAAISEEEWKRKSKAMMYEMNLSFKLEFWDDDFASVRFGRYEFTGGAHGNSYTITLNYDLKNEKILKLTDLFKSNSDYLKTISKFSIDQITKKQGKYASIDWIRNGAGEKLENFKDWNITTSGLKFTFDAYQVGPYAAGSFETIVPLEAFKYEIQSASFSKIENATYIDGNPSNMCRNGHFPSLRVKFGRATLKAKTNFYEDVDGCPLGTNCKKRSYLIAGDEVIVGNSYQDYTCVWYQPKKGSETVGWMPTNRLSMKKETSQKNNWNGEWSFYDNSIKFTPKQKSGYFVITGNAFWKGLGDNVHVGEIEFEAKPKNGLLKVGDENEKYDCNVKFQRVGKYLIVSDNKQCGGMNVSFDGVYRRKS